MSTLQSSVGGDSIDFNAVASSRIGYRAVEPKICEWCGKGFCRVVGSGVKDCADCSCGLERQAAHPVNPIGTGRRKRRAA